MGTQSFFESPRKRSKLFIVEYFLTQKKICQTYFWQKKLSSKELAWIRSATT